MESAAFNDQDVEDSALTNPAGESGARSVSYIGRDGGKSDKHLSVVIQDKTGKAEVKK